MAFIPHSIMQKKLLLLYIANQFQFPLTEEQFIKIILDNNWMTFFDYKDNLSQLLETRQIEYDTSDDISVYKITDEGKTALTHFEKDMPPSLKQTVDTYIELHNDQIKNETLLESSYTYLEGDKLEVTLHVREKTGQLMTISLFVTDEDQAKAICHNWQRTSPSIYNTLMNKLMY